MSSNLVKLWWQNINAKSFFANLLERTREALASLTLTPARAAA